MNLYPDPYYDINDPFTLDMGYNPYPPDVNLTDQGRLSLWDAPASYRAVQANEVQQQPTAQYFYAAPNAPEVSSQPSTNNYYYNPYLEQQLNDRDARFQAQAFASNLSNAVGSTKSAGRYASEIAQMGGVGEQMQQMADDRRRQNWLAKLYMLQAENEARFGIPQPYIPRYMR